MKNIMNFFQKRIGNQSHLRSNNSRFSSFKNELKNELKYFDSNHKENVYQNPIVNACINKIATDSSILKIILVFKENIADGEKKIIEKFFDNPNGKSTKVDFFYDLFYDLLVKGETFIYFNRYDFFILNPDEVEIIYDKYGPIEYRYRNIISDTRYMIHIKDNFKVKTGISRVDNAQSCVKLNDSIEKTLINFIKLHQKIGIILESDEYLDDTQIDQVNLNLRDKLDTNSQENLSNIILTGGMKIKILSMPDIKLDYLSESDKRICAVLGVSHKLVIRDKSQYDGTYESLDKIYYKDTIVPLVQNCIDQLSVWFSQILNERDVVKAFIDYNQMQSYKDDQIKTMTQLKDITFLTEDEKRLLINLPARSNLSN